MLGSRDQAMGLKRTTIILVSGVALAAWFSAAMTPGRVPAAPMAIRPAPIDATGAVLAGEIARLRERLRPDATPRQASRNPFVFRSTRRVPSSAPIAPTSARDASTAAALVDRSRLRLSLVGIAEDPGPAGSAPVRTAIIAGNGQLFLAKEGDIVTDRSVEEVEDVEYRVGNISADSAELTDLRDSTIHRLALK